MHHGVKGMKWGVRKQRPSKGGIRGRYHGARAKMYRNSVKAVGNDAKSIKRYSAELRREGFSESEIRDSVKGLKKVQNNSLQKAKQHEAKQQEYINRQTNSSKGMTRAQRKTSKTARKDAKEYARAKMFYGEGAGTRRKLINATVNQRSKDPFYKSEFQRHLNAQNMDQHANKARSERHRKDVVNKSRKTARGVINISRGNSAAASAGLVATYGALHYTGLDKKIINEGSKFVRKMF